MRTMAIAVLVYGLGVGCSSTAEPAAAEAPEGAEATTGSEALPGSEAATPAATPAEITATQPDAEKLKAHANAHITYPATKAQILEACAQTPEFSEAEKKWVADTLPDGTYNSSDDLLKALQAK